MKSGTVAIVGRSNVGKSTLLNTLLREKLAIVSDKPQTTRIRVLGVLNLPGAQVVLLDTPGLHKPQHLLSQRMVRTALESMREADLLYVMVDATSSPREGDRFVIDKVREVVERRRKPALLLINKIDLVSKPRLLPLIDSYSRAMAWVEIVPISAKTGLNLDRLLDLTTRALSEGEALFDDDVLTDVPARTLAAEIIREKVLEHTREEVPHSVAVEIDQMVEQGKLTRIAACILVERETQKPIILGRRGLRLKAMGTAARLDLARLFGVKVFLEVWVKVKREWREDQRVLAELGY